ncbi:potassium channel family protein [Pleomorphovibrio marinus]|uniref:potassium channel family protein n=1 Tax=Pleomorphovibrio marinus TaxID=2164132 RepID=UPI000E09F13B|nr:NAD-binding protein [Pleomorphovibrio marinus]
MKILTTQVLLFLRNKPDRQNFVLLLKFLLVLVIIVSVFSFIFHLLMLQEGRSFSVITGLYWTLTVMSTLGFGDITFDSDMGRFFSMFVLLSGMLFLLILFPFTFINFFYSPWMKAQEQSKVPWNLPEGTKGHVLLTSYGPVTEALVKKLKRFNYSYVILVPTLSEGLELSQIGLQVMLGPLEDPETYQKARVADAALVATTESDVVNTNVAFTVRGINKDVPIIATCNAEASIDILKLAGANHVLQLGEVMGIYLSRRASVGGAKAHPIGRFGDLLISEALVAGSSLVGKMLKDTKLRQEIGVSVVGVWERGRYFAAQPETRISENTVLVLAGSVDQIKIYNETYQTQQNNKAPILIIGGGRVGRATGKALGGRNIDYRIVEKERERIKNYEKTILGDAAELEVLKEAGIEQTPCVMITSHDDDVNVYLTIYCRQLRPDVQIISRCTLERNLTTLHRAGADFVMSYASIGANMMLNLLQRSDVLMVAEGLDLIKVKVPLELVGKTIKETEIRKETGCTIIGIKKEGKMRINPEPEMEIPEASEIILIGTVASENRFFEIYGSKQT